MYLNAINEIYCPKNITNRALLNFIETQIQIKGIRWKKNNFIMKNGVKFNGGKLFLLI